jgi:RNA polymerase sigma factor (TIGR02999 family)
VSGEITRLLHEVSAGDDSALSRLFETVYEELRARARAQLAGSAPQTIGATGLVHEAYLKLTSGENLSWNDRTHFYRVAARAMRQIAIDRARARNAARRCGHADKINLDAGEISFADSAESLIELDAALDALERHSERLARLVELRFFAGVSVEDCASALGQSERTIKRDWRLARAFIHAALAGKLSATQ